MWGATSGRGLCRRVENDRAPAPVTIGRVPVGLPEHLAGIELVGEDEQRRRDGAERLRGWADGLDGAGEDGQRVVGVEAGGEAVWLAIRRADEAQARLLGLPRAVKNRVA